MRKDIFVLPNPKYSCHLPVGPKGDVLRKAAEALFSEKINEIYGTEREPLCSMDTGNKEMVPNMEVGEEGGMIADFSTVLSSVKRTIAESLGLDEALIENETPLLELGLSSLSANEIATAVGKISGLSLPSSLLYREVSSAKNLTNWILAVRQGKYSYDETRNEEESNKRKSTEFRPTADERTDSTGRVVLLTGGTGFLGSFLLFEFLKMMEGKECEISQVVCLVRGKYRNDCLDRLFSSLERWFGGGSIGISERFSENLKRIFSQRVSAIPGDLVKPKLGISVEDWGFLVEKVDILIHNGASVNLAVSSEKLEKENVNSVGELWGLLGEIKAAKRKFVEFHFVSSVGVGILAHKIYGKDFQMVPESLDIPQLSSQLSGGYAFTKYNAEQLLLQLWEKEKNVPVAVYRPGLIIGSKKSGKGAPENVFSFMVRCASDFRVLPKFEGNSYLVSVDFVAKAISHLALNGTPKTGGEIRVFTIVPEGTGKSWSWVLKALKEECKLEFNLASTFEEWVLVLKEKVKVEKKLAQFLPVVPVFERILHGNGPKFSVEKTISALEKIGILELEDIDEGFLKKHVGEILRVSHGWDSC